MSTPDPRTEAAADLYFSLHVNKTPDWHMSEPLVNADIQAITTK